MPPPLLRGLACLLLASRQAPRPWRLRRRRELGGAWCCFALCLESTATGVEVHAVEEGDPVLNPLVERGRIVIKVELRAAHARSFECACAGFCASVLLTASPDFARRPCSELRNPCAGENYFIIDRCLRARSFSGKTESTKTHTYAADTGDSSSWASSEISRAESSRLGRRLTSL